MEKAGVLIDRLREQLLQKADVNHMLVTAQLLQNELLLQASQATATEGKKVAVTVPHVIPVPVGKVAQKSSGDDPYKPVPRPESEPAPVAEPIPEPESPAPETVPPPTPRPEPEPIPHFVEQKPWERAFPPKEVKSTTWSLDTVSEVPTLAHQQKIVYELNDTMVHEGPSSLNEKLKQNKSEVSSLLHESPIRDLKKAISINDRHRFIRELFRDDENMYERSIKTINSFNIYAEAEYWIQRELKLKIGWDSNLELVKTFDQLVKRRFS